MRSGWLALGAGLCGFVLTSPGVEAAARLCVVPVLVAGLSFGARRTLFACACALGLIGGWRLQAPVDLSAEEPSAQHEVRLVLSETVVAGRASGWVRASATGTVRARVTGLDDLEAGPGTCIVGRALLRDLARRPTPDRRSASRAAVARGERVGVHFREFRVVEKTGPSVQRWWSRALEDRLGPSAGFWSALTVADAQGLDPAGRARVQDLGLAHLLALSGMHVAVVAAALLWPWRRQGRRALVWVLPVLVAWAIVAGSGASLVRAVGMAGWWVLGRRLARRVDPEDGLAAMALVELAWRPQLLCGVGWWLSYVATLAVIVAGRGMVHRPRVPGAIVVSMAAQTATLPWVLDAFGWVNLAAPLVLLLVGPVFAVALTVGLAAIGIGSLVPALGPWTDALAVGAGHVFGASLALCAPLASIGVRSPGLDGLSWAVALALVAVLWWPARLRLRRRVLIAAGLLPLLFVGGERVDHEWILFDVGQGDAGVYRCGARALVIDCGPRYEDVAPASWTVLDWMRRRDLDDVTVALTHGHLDHTGGLAALLGSGRVGNVVVAAADSGRRWVDGVEAAATIAGAGLVRVAAGDRIDLGHCTVAIGWPQQDAGQLHSNDRSLVLSFGPGADRVWSPGDLERAAESRLGPGAPHAWLKVAHHGGDTGTDLDHLRWLRPARALISCGAGNRYGHPDPAVLQRLRDAGVAVHRTDQCGFLRVRWSGAGRPGHLDCGRSGCP